MAGRRLVDAARLFSASKSVAHKHIALRSSQLDTFNQTSSLAKAVKNQTDRITVTAAAAIALSKRFSEEAPSYARAAAEQATGTRRQHEDIPRRDTVKEDAHVEAPKEGLEQDHHYDRSEQNSTVRPPPEAELEIAQEQAQRRPLPDGTIPSNGVTLEQEEKGRLFMRPRKSHWWGTSVIRRTRETRVSSPLHRRSQRYLCPESQKGTVQPRPRLYPHTQTTCSNHRKARSWRTCKRDTTEMSST
jgi:hypothetical protein